MESLSDWPSRRRLAELKDGTLYAAEAGGKFYLLLDNSDFFELLDLEDRLLMGAPFQVHEFATEGERQFFLKQRGWG